MAEFAEVIKQKKRMCSSYKFCGGCGLFEKDPDDCNYFIFNNPEEAEEIIMNWAKEHPTKTNADKFKEVFGIESVCTAGCYGIKCANDDMDCDNCNRKNFWNKEYKEPKK